MLCNLPGSGVSVVVYSMSKHSIEHKQVGGLLIIGRLTIAFILAQDY